MLLTNNLKQIEQDVFQECKMIEKLEIPDTITSFSGSCNSGHALKTIKLSNNQTDMPVLSNCRGLQTIELPNSILTMPEKCFMGCQTLYKVNIPDKITAIPSNAFDTCYALTVLTFPAGITSINTSAFYNTDHMKLFDFSACTQVPTLVSTNAFTGSLKNNCKIKVPAALYEEWIAATNWVSLANYIVTTEEGE